MTPLTEIQARTLGYIMGFICDFGYPPTYREIGNHYKISLQAVTDRLAALERKGRIARDRSPRTISVLADPDGRAARLAWQ